MSRLGKLKSLGSKIKTGAENLPAAAEAFGTSLYSGIKEDVSQRGSAGQRFADAPLGQYYLPKKVQGALSFVAPSPRKVARDTAGVIRNPSPGNIAAEVGNVLSIATLPLMGTGAVKGATAVGRAGQIAKAARGIPLGERIGLAARGALTNDALYHGTTRSAAQAIRRSGFSPVAVGKQYIRDFPAKEGEAIPTFVSTSVKQAASYAAASTRFARLENAAERPAIVVVKASKGARPLLQETSTVRGYGTALAFKTGDVRPVRSISAALKSESGMLQFPRKPGTLIQRMKGRVMNEIQRAAEEGKHMKELPGKIAKTKREIAQIEKAPGNIIDLVKKGERGALKLPGGKEPGDEARRVIKRAQLKAVKASIKDSVRVIRENLSTNTTEQLHARSAEADRLFSKAPQVKGFRKFVKRELGARAAAPDTIVQTLGQTKSRVYDSRNWGFANYTAAARTVHSLPKIAKTHASRLPRN